MGSLSVIAWPPDPLSPDALSPGDGLLASEVSRSHLSKTQTPILKYSSYFGTRRMMKSYYLFLRVRTSRLSSPPRKNVNSGADAQALDF
jgi:hypothetical protein